MEDNAGAAPDKPERNEGDAHLNRADYQRRRQGRIRRTRRRHRPTSGKGTGR